jgi:hydroxyacylglutathione hydrolase
MFVRQFFIKGIAHSSYLVGGNRTCAIVDPSRDIDRYLEAAKEEGLRITHILETHLHADFVSGHLELAEATGAKIYAPLSGNCSFDHVPVSEGSSFTIEDMRFDVLDTPGHTPDCIVYIVTDLLRGDTPAAAFTGDTLFVGDVGRPDLFPGRARELAEKLYGNLHDKVMALSDSCLVFPAHGAGSLCGKAMGAMRWSTVGYERSFNRELLIEDREEFIASLTVDMPAAPDHFTRCSEINRRGPALARTLPVPQPLSPGAFTGRMKDPGVIVVDTRHYASFSGQHIPGSWHIDLAGNFSTFSGWVLPPDRDILLVCDRPDQVSEAVTMLRRVGLDRTAGYLDGGIHAWVLAGLPTAHLPLLSAEEVREMLESGAATLLDVRSAEEFQAFHVPGAVHIMAMDLRTRYQELDPSMTFITMCKTGIRASMAASILKQHGFDKLYNAAGGITAYIAAGYLQP